MWYLSAKAGVTMRIVMFYHSLISDWDKGDAHAMREVVGELLSRGHVVRIYEPRGDSYHRRPQDGLVRSLETEYRCLRISFYDLDVLDIGAALDGADLVVVHERGDPCLVRKVGRHREMIGRYMLIFHDTRHWSITGAESITSHDLLGYDGVLASDESVRQTYLARGRAGRAWTWPESPDTPVHCVDGLLNIYSEFVENKLRRSEGVADEVDRSRIILLPGVTQRD